MHKQIIKPPNFLRNILGRIINGAIRKGALTEFDEEFQAKSEKNGYRKTCIWYFLQIIALLPEFLRDKLYWSLTMFKNYLKITIRNFMRQKGYSFINIAGLAIGMACCILIMLYVQDEMSYDKFNKNADRIYRITSDLEIRGGVQNLAMAPFVTGPVFTSELPEIESYTRIFGLGNPLVNYNGRTHEETGLFTVDSSFFSIFTHNFISGNPDDALDSPTSVVITDEVAARIFGDEDPLGKTMTFNFPGNIGQLQDFQVTGVIENVPANTHFHFNYLFPASAMPQAVQNNMNTQWFLIQGHSYILLNKDADPSVVEQKIRDVYEGVAGERGRQVGIGWQFYLQKVTDIHLRSQLEGEIEPTSDILYVFVFSAIAIFILVIACINFMNLSTAKSANRAREVGMRKVFGAYKKNLIWQFLTESFLLSLMGILAAIILVVLLLPEFNSLTEKNFSMNILLNPGVFLSLIGIVIFTGLFAGSYPAFFLSAFRPNTVLKGAVSRGAKSGTFRKSLAIFQFSISIVLIVSTLLVIDQLNFMKNKDLGFDKEQILVVTVTDATARQRYNTIKTEMKRNPNILETTFSSSVPGRGYNLFLFLPEGRSQNEAETMNVINVDFDFLKTYGIEIAHGRDYSRDFSTDTSTAFLMNEKAAEKLGWGKDAVGKGFAPAGAPNFPSKIIGVFKDYHHRSLKQIIEPLVLNYQPRAGRFLSMKVNTDNLDETIEFVKEKWKVFDPNRELSYFFIDESFDAQYRFEDTLSEIFSYFAFLAILIACLGLFGLASFTAEQRTREIGIRKVLGASTDTLVVNLTREFIKWVLIANMAGLPVAYLIMNKYWLSNFAFKITPGLSTFAIAFLASVVIALLTVSFQA
ncbi:MAG: FtsX-like permease family protein, partial [bacterium]|nr:FtsX-like permease family protein [bacterium]